jgi:hypothetical protein
MPLLVAKDDFVQFVFRPKAHFKPDEYLGITNPVLVELMNNLPRPRYCPLILDGGNIVKASNKVIITAAFSRTTATNSQKLKFWLNWKRSCSAGSS